MDAMDKVTKGKYAKRAEYYKANEVKSTGNENRGEPTGTPIKIGD
jgi:hypothetical protein